MDIEHNNHLNNLMEDFVVLARRKYEKGQIEHGGNLWEKRGLIDMAIEEAIDQVVYLLTLKFQIDESGIQLGKLDEPKQTT